MPGRHTCSLPQAASETSDAVLLFFIGFPHKQSYTVSQRLAYFPHLALQWGVNILVLMHSWFSLVFHLHFIMLGEMSLQTFLRTSVNKIGMFPNSFVMRCNGAPLSCGANPIWGNFGISIRAVLLSAGVFFVTLAWAEICDHEQKLCNGCLEAVNWFGEEKRFSSHILKEKESGLSPTLLLCCYKVTYISPVSPREEYQMWLPLADIICSTAGQAQPTDLPMVTKPLLFLNAWHQVFWGRHLQFPILWWVLGSNALSWLYFVPWAAFLTFVFWGKMTNAITRQ